MKGKTRIYQYLKNNKNDVLFVDRTGTIVCVYLKNDVKILFPFNTINKARRNYTVFRRELEGIKI